MLLLSPPPDVPANLVPIWPWIWLQHQILLAWIRLTYGRGYRYCWGVTHSGRVVLVCIDLDSRDRVAALSMDAPVSGRLADALSGTDFAPAFVQYISHHTQQRAASARVLRHPAVQATALPLPDS